jgi:PiT family inorganic phosphate transporter
MNGTWWIYLPVCLVLFVSCLVGNTKILKNIGRGMAQLKRYQAFSTDIAASIGLIIATLFGVPLSTGTIKNTAIVGSGATKSIRRIKWKKAGSIILWGALVFPFAAIMGFIVTMIFVWTC